MALYTEFNELSKYFCYLSRKGKLRKAKCLWDENSKKYRKKLFVTAI